MFQHYFIKAPRARPAEEKHSFAFLDLGLVFVIISPHFSHLKELTTHNETDISAFQTQTQKQTRLSKPHADQGRKKYFKKKTAEKAHATDASMSIGNASFPKKEHVRRPSEFLAIFKTGSSIRENGVALYFKKNPSVASNRIGIVVSRKILPRAVDRNRAKRLIHEFFRNHRNSLAPHHEIVVRLLEVGNSLSSSSLREILEGLFKRAGLLS